MRRGNCLLSAAPALIGATLLACLTTARADDAKGRPPAPASRPSLAEPTPPGWKLVWSDEFIGPAIDRSKWDFDRGTHLPVGPNQWVSGWGNDELQFYTSRPENAYIRRGLHLRALRGPFKGAQYSSARLKTRSLFSKTYGRFEFKASLPTGKGIWPAIWMLPERKVRYGGWPASGEIDIVEARGQEPGKVLGTLHYGSRWPANTHAGAEYVLPGNGTIAGFHVYALEWEPGEIRWYVDDHLYQVQNFWWSCSDTDGPNGVDPVSESELNPWPAPFDQPFHILLNVAVGGQFPGNPDATTVFPAEMVIEYVRVYEKISGYGPVKPRGIGKLPFANP